MNLHNWAAHLCQAPFMKSLPLAWHIICSTLPLFFCFSNGQPSFLRTRLHHPTHADERTLVPDIQPLTCMISEPDRQASRTLYQILAELARKKRLKNC